MKLSLYNIGCKLNYAETLEIGKQFKQNGFKIVDFGEEADVVLINTCTVTSRADADCRKIIRRARRQNPNAFVGVMGCYAQLKHKEAASIESVDAIFGSQNKYDILKLIEDFKKRKSPEVFIANPDDAPFHAALSDISNNRARAIFKIQDGCDYRCSYCAVPLARGGSRSMPFDSLRDALIKFNETDFNELILSGVNIGEYKAASGERFIDVVNLINELDLNFRVRISSIEPNLINDKLIEAVKTSETFCRHFHIPLQSGSPKILKLMKRRYSADVFEEVVGKIKTEIPDCCVGADVIEGFPGEGDKEFAETYDLLQRLPASYLHVFTFSEREGTPAAEFPNAVHSKIRKERTRRLRELSNEKREEFYSLQIGKEGVVIPEKIIEEKGEKFLKGWTDNYVKTIFCDEDFSFNPTPVRIKESDKDCVIGEKRKL